VVIYKYMTYIQAFRVLAIKTLAIIGFVATGVLIVWLLIVGIQYMPGAFASLASIAESINTYRPAKELTLATEKTVVNSGESLTLSWTDMKQKHGTYVFSYTCTPGVTLEVKTLDGSLRSLTCNETFPLSPIEQSLTLYALSHEARFTDVPVTVSFSHETTDTRLESTTKITVVNATIPVGGIVVEEEEKEEERPVITTPTPAPKPQTPTPPLLYPQSNPNGFTDLAISTIGVGTLINGTFVYTATYDPDVRSAIKFDVKNIGTKTSETFVFTTLLPNGTTYTSPVQPALKPGERIEFTLGFDLGETRKEFVQVTSTVIVRGDTHVANNTSVWSIKVAN